MAIALVGPPSLAVTPPAFSTSITEGPGSAGGTACSLGSAWVPCDNSIGVRYINLASEKVRDMQMTRQLTKAKRRSPYVSSFQRFEAVEMECPLPDGAVHEVPACSGQPCNITGGDSQFTIDEIFSALAPSIQNAYNQAMNLSYRGVLGAWASHASVLKEFVGGNPSTEFLLTLEDDAVIGDEFFDKLPSFLSELPKDELWHAVRFSTWNELWEPGRIRATPIYKAEQWGTPNQTFNAAASKEPHLRVFWGGAHATLFQRQTAAAMLSHMTGCGAGCPDIEGYRDFSAITEDMYIATSNQYCVDCTSDDIAYPLLCQNTTDPANTAQRVADCLKPIGAYTVQVPELLRLQEDNTSGTIAEPNWNTTIPTPKPKAAMSTGPVWPPIDELPYSGPDTPYV